MKNFYILDANHVINLDEIQAIEFYGKINSGEYRIKILFKGNEIHHFDVSEKDYNTFKFLFTEDRIC